MKTLEKLVYEPEVRNNLAVVESHTSISSFAAATLFNLLVIISSLSLNLYILIPAVQTSKNLKKYDAT